MPGRDRYTWELTDITDLLVFLVLYLVVNLFAFGAFAFDKWKAQRTAWRISENTLLALAFLGPAGAFSAMRFFRHKTRKPKFYLVSVFLIIHLVIIAYLVSRVL
jgi:uncharacterized membrane protein YsdA (DUF1294 family)